MSPSCTAGRRFVGDVAAFATALVSTVAALATTLGGGAPWPASPADPVVGTRVVVERSARSPGLELFARGGQVGECARDTSGGKE